MTMADRLLLATPAHYHALEAVAEGALSGLSWTGWREEQDGTHWRIGERLDDFRACLFPWRRSGSRAARRRWKPIRPGYAAWRCPP